MSVAALTTVAFAPAASRTGGFPVSTAVIVIIVLVAVLGALAVLGWRAPDRSPGADTQAERERIED
jgi:hypothetical protein